MAQEKVHLTCGTVFEIEDAPESGIFIEIEDVVTFGGEIGQLGTYLDSTTVKDCGKTYIAGLSDAPDLTISFLYSPTTNQENLRDGAIAGENRQARITFADDGGSPVATAEFEIALAGFTMNDPAPDTILTASVSGKASKFAWS